MKKKDASGEVSPETWAHQKSSKEAEEFQRVYQEGVEEFRHVFSPHFPNLSKDYERASFEFDWIENTVFGNPMETMRHSKAKRELLRLKSALNLILREDLPLPTILGFALWEASERGDKLAKCADDIFRGILEFQAALAKAEDDAILAPAIDRLIAETERIIDQTQETGNTNWEAVHAVESLRTLWWRNTGEAGPARALNPASKFATYLRDGFSYLEIDADAVSAFKRWAAWRRT